MLQLTVSLSRKSSQPAREMTRAVGVAAIAALALAWVAFVVAPDLPWAVDYRINVWEPGRAVLDGENPLRPDGLDGTVYPPAATLTTLPFALVPYELGVLVWLALLLAAVPLALWLSGVRDWRCVVLAFGSPPVVVGLAYANSSLLLLLAVAGLWRARERPWLAGALLGMTIAGKLFLWPLLLWLLLTRRHTAAVSTGLLAVVVSAAAFGVVGFGLVDDFVEVTRENAARYHGSGVSVAAFAATLGASVTLATSIGIGVAAVLLVTAWWWKNDDVACFTLCLVAALAMTPVMWAHYYALLLVPLALTSPSFSRAWLYPYLTVPQLTMSFSVPGRLLDCISGFLFAAVVMPRSLWLTRRTSALRWRAARSAP